MIYNNNIIKHNRKINNINSKYNNINKKQINYSSKIKNLIQKSLVMNKILKNNHNYYNNIKNH